MRLKPIPTNTVVHTPTEAEAKELLSILHENGYKWCGGSSLIEDSEWDGYQEWTCYWISSYVEIDNIHECSGGKIKPISLAEFKRLYYEEEQPQPKFKVDDWVIHNHKNCEVGQIVKYFPDKKYCYSVRFGNEYHNMAEHQLLPYPEPETKDEAMETKDETKELNLCELLKGHEGETFYSPIFGERKFVGIEEGMDYPISFGEAEYYDFGIDGCWSDGGLPVLFPSRALYEQYPLDPYAAWMKWQEEQKKHWVSVTAWIDDLECESDTAIDTDKIYFRTTADRDKCIEEIKAIINKYSK